ncbi:MAG: hypothetical protein K1X54_00050 [Flavobacteriales bacterium]|nr:hypothetical protein [Flavobacteriales bacterium]
MRIALMTSSFAIVIALLYSCSKDPERLVGTVRYDWVETQIYYANEDTVVTIRPTSFEETYSIVYETYENHTYGYIYQGEELKMEGLVVDFVTASGNETSCLYEEDCRVWQDNFQLCQRRYSGNIYVVYQFPYLDGDFGNCHSSSLFEVTYRFHF